jgi:hypothetical protein
MSKAQVSITAYCIYLGSNGAVAAFKPSLVSQVLRVPPTREVWIRLFGSLAVVLAAKGFYAVRLNLIPTFQFDVYTRTAFAIFLTVLIIMGISPTPLLILAVIDIVCAVWTQLALVADRRPITPRNLSEQEGELIT